MRILYFSQFAPPELGAAPARLHAHARAWATAGNEVDVITSVPNAPRGRFHPGYRNRWVQTELLDGIRFVRVFTVPAGKESSFFVRLAGALTYVLMSILIGIRGRRPDLVLATVPYLAGVPGYLASRWHRVPLVYEMRDPWLQVAAQRGGGLRWGVGLLARVEMAIARRAARVVVIGDEMADFIQRTYDLADRPVVLPNAATPSEDAPRADDREALADSEALLGFIGNMGSQYDLELLLDVAGEVTDLGCRFLLLGEGAQKPALKSAVARRGLENVEFREAVAPADVAGWIRRCAATVVPLREGELYRQYVPVKILDSLACGVPVLLAGEGDAARLLRESEGGIVVAAGDREAFAGAVRAAMSDPEELSRRGGCGRDYVHRERTRDRIAARYLELFDGLVSGEEAS